MKNIILTSLFVFIEFIIVAPSAFIYFYFYRGVSIGVSVFVSFMVGFFAWYSLDILWGIGIKIYLIFSGKTIDDIEDK